MPTNRYGKLSGLGNYELQELDYKGDDLNTFINKKFKIDRGPIGTSLFRSSSKLLRNMFYAKPVIVSDKCTKCGICVDECPVKGKALQFKKLNGKTSKKEPPVYDYNKCIRCYCCQEMCPYKAIYLKKPLLRKILKK